MAAAESMTHDVIRDLLGVKLDVTSYMVSLSGEFLWLIICYLIYLGIIWKDE